MSQLRRVVNHLAFGHLKYDALNRELISDRGSEYAGNRVWRRLQALGKKIEIEPARYAEPCRLRDGEDTRPPVEVVKISRPYLLKYRRGRFATGLVIKVKLKDGTVLEADAAHAHGEPEWPLTDGEIRDKFLNIAGPVLGADAKNIAESIENIAEQPQVSHIARMLAE